MSKKTWMVVLLISMAMATEWTPGQHVQYQEMIRQFHCRVCYQESLIDSRSPFAERLRSEIHRLVDEGSSNTRIIDYITSRYGKSINYEPAHQGEALLLWMLPLVVWGLVVRRLQHMQRAPLI